MLDIVEPLKDRQVFILAQKLGIDFTLLHLRGREKKRFLGIISWVKCTHCYINIENHVKLTKKLVDRFMSTGSFVLDPDPNASCGRYVVACRSGYQPFCLSGEPYQRSQSLVLAFLWPQKAITYF